MICKTNVVDICSKHLQLEFRGESSLSSSFLKPKLELVSSKRAEFQKVELFWTVEFELLGLKFESKKSKSELVWSEKVWASIAKGII
jgi:hypothetical protein